MIDYIDMIAYAGGLITGLSLILFLIVFLIKMFFERVIK